MKCPNINLHSTGAYRMSFSRLNIRSACITPSLATPFVYFRSFSLNGFLAHPISICFHALRGFNVCGSTKMNSMSTQYNETN